MGHTNHDRRESGSLQYPRGKNQGYSGAFSCSVNYCGTNGRLGRALVKTAGGFAPELADAGHCGGHGSTKDSGYVGTCRGVWIKARQQRLASACLLSAEEAAQRDERKGHKWEHFHKCPSHGSGGLQGRAQV